MSVCEAMIDLVDEYLPMYDPPDAHANAAALRRMADGVHYDLVTGDLAPPYEFVLRRDRPEAPRPIYRWQRSLPGVYVLYGPCPKPRAPKPEAVSV